MTKSRIFALVVAVAVCGLPVFVSMWFAARAFDAFGLHVVTVPGLLLGMVLVGYAFSRSNGGVVIAPLALLVASIGGIRMAHGYGKAQVRSFCEAELRAPGTVVGLDDKWTTVASRANLTCRVHDLEPVNWWSVLVYSGDELVGHLEVTRPTPSAPFRLRP